jgi:hypothetical protein
MMLSIRRRKAEMAEPQYKGGGFGNSLLDGMSPATRAQVMQADAEYERAAAAAEREAAARRDRLREQGFRASVQAAWDRGELVDMRQAMRDGGVGRTVQEVIEHASVMMDVEDARQEAEQRRVFEKWRAERFYGDVPSPAEKVELEEAGAARAEARREARHRVRSDARAARRQRAETARLIRADRQLIAEGLGGIRPEDV